MSFSFVPANKQLQQTEKPKTSQESFVLGDHQKRAIAYLCKHPYSLLVLQDIKEVC